MTPPKYGRALAKALPPHAQPDKFIQLAEVPVDAMDPRTRMITAHAVCGFANFGSMGILIGGLTIIEPARRDDFLSLAWRTLLAGTLATCLSGAVVAALPFQLFVGTGG